MSCTLFWVGGRFTGSAARAKILQIGLRLTGRAAPTARLQLLVSAPDEVDALTVFLAELGPVGTLPPARWGCRSLVWISTPSFECRSGSAELIIIFDQIERSLRNSMTFLATSDR